MGLVLARIVRPVLVPCASAGADEGAVEQDDDATLSGDFLQGAVQSRGTGRQQLNIKLHAVAEMHGHQVCRARYPAQHTHRHHQRPGWVRPPPPGAGEPPGGGRAQQEGPGLPAGQQAAQACGQQQLLGHRGEGQYGGGYEGHTCSAPV
ncbi:hypothetical protein OHS71_00890 [Streptomyces sp. NBC_00377]|uniref:hypothetical protein n=1 Tax=unclassified Streptomyces TaxID=2593676 RepID=UPI002E1BCE68|nr:MULTISPECIES: hypothetical protein [unclassified Streptomyces]